MRLKNTSQYDTEECRRLIEFAVKGIRMTGVGVNLKGSQYAMAGYAYDGVSSYSPLRKLSTVKRMITLRIGAAEKFPCDNMRNNVRWERCPDEWTWEQAEEKYGKGNVCSHQVYKDGVMSSYIKGCIVKRHPYGGERSPLIECKNWREGLVAIAAHEARHIHQYRHGKRRSEVDCERFAAKRLEEYRKSLEVS